ncbi:MAG TPA: hypothetical protein VLJ59_14630 [Mycobacteriales bacterium]|nr:hypothetical protein [Mycobacteriales bacterium]
MPTLPWSTPKDPPKADKAFVMASRLELRSLRTVPSFFLKSLAAWKQVRRAPGVLGASLIAQPTKRVFWTLSAWDGRGPLYEYAKTNPHGDIMRGFKPAMRRSTFVTWTVPTGELPITWDDARRRLADQVAAEDAGAAAD